MSKANSKLAVTKIAVVSMLSAVAIVLQYLEVSVPLVPSFLKLDFSDIPELIGSFVIGPGYGVLICLIKNIVHLPFTGSVGVGEFSNFLLGAVFVFVAGIIYKYKRTKGGAMIACFAGAATMAAISIVSNYFVVYPVYAQLWAGGDMNVIINMYKAILPYSDSLIKSLVIFNLPFTFVKGIIVAAITMVVYKPMSGMIVRMNDSFNRRKESKKGLTN